MSSNTQHCSNCGFLMDADCEFCPGCGALKAKSAPRPTNTREPHAWMREASPAAQPAVSATLVQPVPVPVPQVQYVPYVASPPVVSTQDNGLAATVRTLGIVAISLMLIGFIPCLGWLNYLNLTFSFVTVILSIVALAQSKSDSARSAAIIGLALVVVAICLGMGRLIIGGGCL